MTHQDVTAKELSVLWRTIALSPAACTKAFCLRVQAPKGSTTLDLQPTPWRNPTWTTSSHLKTRITEEAPLSLPNFGNWRKEDSQPRSIGKFCTEPCHTEQEWNLVTCACWRRPGFFWVEMAQRKSHQMSSCSTEGWKWRPNAGINWSTHLKLTFGEGKKRRIPDWTHHSGQSWGRTHTCPLLEMFFLIFAIMRQSAYHFQRNKSSIIFQYCYILMSKYNSSTVISKISLKKV